MTERPSRSPSELRVLCVSGASGSGKTTLIRRLLPALPRSLGPLAVLKHTHHAIDWHPAGKDSRVLWEAGPAALCVAGPDQTALFVRSDTIEGPPPPAGSARVPPAGGTGADAATDDASPAATRRLVRACRRLCGDARLVIAEGFGEVRVPTVWTADGPPGPIGPGVRAVVVPARHAAAWQASRPELPVHRRDDVEEIAGRLAALAGPLSAIGHGPDGPEGRR